MQRPQPQQQNQQRVISSGQQSIGSLDSQFDGQAAPSARAPNTQSQSAADFPPLGHQLNLHHRRQAPGLNGLGQMNGQLDQSSETASLDGELLQTCIIQKY